MINFQRKAALGAAIIITAASAAVMTMGSAHAATAASAGPAAHTARGTAAAPPVRAVPQASAAVTWPLVRPGATGERVYAIQYLLNYRIGAGLAIDGKFGSATTAAVKKFQARVGLSADGIVGPQTWSRLIVQVQQGNSGSAVSAVQHNLRFGYGYTNVAVDGIFGPITKTAVRAFQAKFKIGVDGIVGPVTWNTLIVNEG